ncbi:MAG: carboxyl transferase domain-containing protein [Actinomycetota bacterium]
MSSGLLIANRGEIAVRIARSAAEAGLRTVSVHSDDDADSLHVRRTDETVRLTGAGPAAYLDVEQIVTAAQEAGCDLLHPGYGFLSERAELAAGCEAAGIGFVGPRPATLARFGDKLSARALADELGVPLLPGTSGATGLDEALAVLDRLGPDGALMVKAVAGGGGRGMRVARSDDELASAMERCASEARTAFGDGALYVEQYLPSARHVEVQLIGDGSGRVAVLGDRECSLQRRHQKIVEIAPAPHLDADVRARLADAATALGEATQLRSLATVEFLVTPDGGVAFLEVNARLQVEHTVTEQVTGLDLVGLQLHLAAGATLDELGLGEPLGDPDGTAVQLRITTEALQADGSVRPTGGVVSALEIPSGPGVRVDSALHVGFRPHPAFDSMVAKLIAHVPGGDLAVAARRADRALVDLRLDGLDTNVGLLRALLEDPAVLAGEATTTHVESNAGRLVARAAELAPVADAAAGRPGVGARVDAVDPLAVLDHGRGGAEVAARTAAAPVDDGTVVVPAPLQGTIVSVAVEIGAAVTAGDELAVMEAMKMEHVIAAPRSGTVLQVLGRPGDTIADGDGVIHLEVSDAGSGDELVTADVDLELIRPDLAEIVERHEIGLDEARPAAVERRRKTGQRTARENVADLCDDGTFVEYGPLVLAAQRRRRSVEELIAKTPADGLVGGVGSINGDLFDPPASQAVVMSYDYTVLAGTQGNQNHRKKDRLFEVAARQRLPVVLLSEGGGGRPGDTDGLGVAGLDCLAFRLFGELSGLVPLVGINSGRCFAGNAALLGCCDVVIATANSNIGMGGPAMIEGGGLGVFRPEEVGPMDVQVPNGVVDIAVADEAEAIEVAKRYLSYFQGPLGEWECADQRRLRHAIPENRLRAYDIRQVVTGLADTGSVLELRRSFGVGMVTALARIEGRPVGIVANDPTHLGGAIDSEGADKAARFLQLCDAFDLPIVFLCDTPGIMVGPEAETSGTVRHASRLFVVGGSLSVPFVTVVLRKGYGLGAQAMAGGSFHAPLFTVAWPTGEFGGMGLEGAVKLGYRDELAAVEDTEERRELFEEMVARMYDHGKALNFATHFEIDDVIDPADTRRWITSALVSAPTPPPRDGKKRPCIDTW